jgi:hypothetical protein
MFWRGFTYTHQNERKKCEERGDGMAIPLWQMSIVSRSNNGSAVERAAYLFGTTFTSDYDGKTYDHTEKRLEVLYTHIFAPQNEPAWVYDPLQLTNSIEHAESRKDAQLLRSIYFAFPREFTREQQIVFLEEYVQTFVQKGMIAICALHDSGHGNPNGHVLLTMRKLESDGTWAPKATLEYVRDANGEKIKLPSGHYKTKKHNTTNWNNRNNVELWRQEWATLVNTHLARYGHSARIDPRSYKRQGKKQIPTLRLSPDEYDLEKRGIPTPRGDINRLIRAKNQQQEEQAKRKARKRRCASPPQRKGQKALAKQHIRKAHRGLHKTQQILKQLSFTQSLQLAHYAKPKHHARPKRELLINHVIARKTE